MARTLKMFFLECESRIATLFDLFRVDLHFVQAQLLASGYSYGTAAYADAFLVAVAKIRRSESRSSYDDNQATLTRL